MKNVLFISYYFPPMGGAGVQRSAKFVKYLPRFGWRPIVLTTTQGSYHVHREFQLDETVGAGLDESEHEVHRLRDPEPRRFRRFLERMRIFPLFWFFLYPLFWEPQVFWAVAAVIKGLRLIREKGIIAVYTTSGPYSTVLTGLLLKWFTRKPWIADLRDPWTKDFIGMWPSLLHQRLEQWFARFALRRADHVIANTPISERLFEELLGEDCGGRISSITNGYDEGDFLSSERVGNGTVFRIAHVGSLGTGAGPVRRSGLKRLPGMVKRLPEGYDTTAYSARYFLQGLHILVRERAIAPDTFQVDFAGFVPEECVRKIKECGLEKVVSVQGYRPHAEAVSLLENADALWLPLPVPGEGRPLPQVPGKLYEYMRSGKPVLALIPPGDAYDFLKESGVGFFADPRNPEDIARALLQLYEEHRNGGIGVKPNWDFIRRFERKRLTSELARVFDSLVERGASSGRATFRPQWTETRSPWREGS